MFDKFRVWLQDPCPPPRRRSLTELGSQVHFLMSCVYSYTSCTFPPTELALMGFWLDDKAGEDTVADSHLGVGEQLHVSRPFFSAAGRSVAHVRCNHSNIISADVHQSITKFICLKHLTFAVTTNAFSILLRLKRFSRDPGKSWATRSWLLPPDPGY